MAPNIEITSKEMIKPSSPTPPSLRNLKLSFLDQMTPPSYIPLIFFYKHSQPKLEESLKKSLSDVLTKFYPLAGRFSRENSTVDCNDTGALFVECKVHGNLSEAIKDPAMEELQKYLPPAESSKNIVLAVQTNRFDCGGIAVAVQMHHNLGDANSLASFMNAWAAASRGDDDHHPRDHQTFEMATLFPPKDNMFSDSMENTIVPEAVMEKVVTKRLVFDKKDLENLKLLASSEAVKDPTRVEAVSSFLVKRFREASRARGSKKNIAVTHVVNLRPRMDPPLPKHAFGNVINGVAVVLPDDSCDLVRVLRDAIGKIDGDFVEKVQNGGDDYFNHLNGLMEVCLKEETWLFSSWARIPVYEVDYGWGRPVWVTTTTLPYKNMVVLMTTSSEEDGIEAWVNLLEEDAAFIGSSLSNY